jgi:TetR/AcrR family transcriptional repressor of nem operon
MSTSTATTTKERILDAAEALMLTKSFHSVGLNEILSAVRVPKGSFYHYFQSKEQFGVELIKHYVAEATAHKRRMLLSPDLDSNPLERLVAFLNSAVAKMLEKDCRQSCLVLKLGAEVSTMSDDMRAVLAEGMRQWHGIYEQLIREGQEKAVIRADIDPSTAAAMMADYWMGALQRMLVQSSVAPLKTAVAFIRQYLTPA